MSANSSTPSPTSGSRSHDADEDNDLTADLDLGFDGAEDLLRVWRQGLRPDPNLTVSEWADQHRWLSSRGAAEPGRYRTARAPYLREIMDALSPGHPAQRITFMKAAQVGATEAGNNWIGFVIHHAPGPMLAVLPSLELAKRTSRGRLDPLIADSPALRERVNPARSRDAGNSMLSKEFPGGIAGLRSVSYDGKTVTYGSDAELAAAIRDLEGRIATASATPRRRRWGTLYNYFSEFGLAQISVDFVLGTAGTNVQGKVREVLRAIEDNLLGEAMTSVHALVSREFFDKLIAHPKTEEAYKFYASTGAQPLREDVRRNFPFGGILFEEYSGTVTLSTKATERLVPANEGIAFPLGTMDTFTTYGGPANLLETANTIGLPLYARQHLDEKGRWIDVMTEASILPVNKRPRLAVRIHSSN